MLSLSYCREISSLVVIGGLFCVHFTSTLCVRPFSPGYSGFSPKKHSKLLFSVYVALRLTGHFFPFVPCPRPMAARIDCSNVS